MVERVGVEPHSVATHRGFTDCLPFRINQVDWLGLHRSEAVLLPLCVYGT